MNCEQDVLGLHRDPLVAQIAEFLVDIGLPIKFATIEGETFMPGVGVRNGILTIDQAKLLYPGDLLHEAGHLAVLPASERKCIDGDVGDNGGFEMGAIAWSYAAALHLGIDPAVVFHAAGYRGGSDALLENFAAGNYIGVPILEWVGLTVTEKRAKDTGVAAYPTMTYWLRKD